jgi:sortase A
MKKALPTIILTVIFLAGVCLLLYPSVSNWYNSIHQSKMVQTYSDVVDDIGAEKIANYLSDAQEYNEKLASRGYTSFVLSDSEEAEYESKLDLSDIGLVDVISYIEIPSIRVKLPIYHGTSDAALSAGVGHFAGSSLPVGGASTHCVLSGHRGLPSAKLFTDLDRLVVGDVFMLNTLNETLTYEVDQILVVEPNDISALGIVQGQDLCTLVTCTPYGINTQRLLVRGHRIANLDAGALAAASSDADQIEPIMVAPFATIPILIIMLIVVFRNTRRTGSAYAPDKFEDELFDEELEEEWSQGPPG